MIDARWLAALLVASLTLNGFALVQISGVDSEVDALRSRTAARHDVRNLEARLNALDRAFADLKAETGLVSGSRVIVDEEAASCDGVPARFDAALNRAPVNATVTLAYWPVWNALTPSENEGVVGSAIENGTVSYVPASSVEGLRYAANATLSDAFAYEYRWFVNGTTREASGTYRVDVWSKLSAGRTGKDLSGNSDTVHYAVTSGLDTRVCARTASATMVIQYPNGTIERETMTREPAPRGIPQWNVTIPHAAYRDASRVTVEWRLDDGTVVVHDLHPARSKAARS